MKQNLLVTISDENYVNQAKQFFSSVYFNSGWDGDYMLISHEIPEKKLKWFREKGILVKKIKPITNEKVGRFQISSATMDKFYLFTPEFKKWDVIIYFDADFTIQKSLDLLKETKGFVATEMIPEKVKNTIYPFSNNSNSMKLIKELKQKFNLKKQKFNAGFFAFNTQIIIENLFPQMKKIFKKYKTVFPDNEEQVLNIIFRNIRKKTSILYNYLYVHLKDKKYAEKAIALHFMSYYPWKKEHPFNQTWEENLKKAEKINLKKRLPAKETLTKEQIRKYTKGIKRALFIEKTIIPIKDKLEKVIGKTGKIIKNISPKIYKILGGKQ